MYSHVHCSIIYNSQDMEKDVQDSHICTHTHTHTHMMEYYSAIKKSKISPFELTWIELEHIMLNGISQTKKDKYWMISFLYGI